MTERLSPSDRPLAGERGNLPPQSSAGHAAGGSPSRARPKLLRERSGPEAGKKFGPLDGEMRHVKLRAIRSTVLSSPGS
jgi:hypothetical protein